MRSRWVIAFWYRASASLPLVSSARERATSRTQVGSARFGSRYQLVQRLGGDLGSPSGRRLLSLYQCIPGVPAKTEIVVSDRKFGCGQCLRVLQRPMWRIEVAKWTIGISPSAGTLAWAELAQDEVERAVLVAAVRGEHRLDATDMPSSDPVTKTRQGGADGSA